jgi:hypothetical protein
VNQLWISAAAISLFSTRLFLLGKGHDTQVVNPLKMPGVIGQQREVMMQARCPDQEIEIADQDTFLPQTATFPPKGLTDAIFQSHYLHSREKVLKLSSAFFRLSGVVHPS